MFVGQAKLAVIVNQANPVRGLSVGQIQKALVENGQGLQWAGIGGDGGRVKCYGETYGQGSRQLLRLTCLQYEKKTGWFFTRFFYPYRKDFAECMDADDVVTKVKHDPNGIGFIFWTGQRIQGVKVVPVKPNDSGSLVALKEARCIQKDYPLSEQLVLYVHPSRPAAAEEFADFAVGPEGSAIAEKFGLVTPYMQHQAEAKARLAEAEGGQGREGGRRRLQGACGGDGRFGRRVRQGQGGCASAVFDGERCGQRS